MVYAIAGAVAYDLLGDPTYFERLRQPAFLLGMLLLTPISALGTLIGYRLSLREAGRRVVGVRRGWEGAWHAARRGAFNSSRLSYVAAVLLVAPLFFNVFLAWKLIIPVIHPFRYDASLADLGSLLHGGPPHRLLNWVPLGIVDWLYYYGWLYVMVAGLFVMAWQADTRGLMAFCLTWVVLGTVVATLISSAGPPFFKSLTGDTRYAALFARLDRNGHPIVAVTLQHSLWEAYQSHRLMTGAGISAFPSMHVAVPTLYTCIAWRRSRVLSVVLGMFTIVILIGSVGLGWHYVLDGYASLVGVPPIWWLSGALAGAPTARSALDPVTYRIQPSEPCSGALDPEELTWDDEDFQRPRASPATSGS